MIAIKKGKCYIKIICKRFPPLSLKKMQSSYFPGQLFSHFCWVKSELWRTGKLKYVR